MREILDYPKNIFSKHKSLKEARDDFYNDLNVNMDGLRMGRDNLYNSAFEACDKYRPKGYDPQERFKYYIR